MSSILEQPTIARAFLRSVEENRDRVAVHEYGTGRELTYGEWKDRAAAVAGGLARLGVERGDRVALLTTNSLDFFVVDMGAVLLGAAPFSLYNTAPVEQLLVNVDNAEPKIVIVEPQFAERARELVALRPQIQLLVLGEDDFDAPGFDVVATAEAVQPEDLLTLVYTSGTTGAPKGVQYVHGGLMYAVNAFAARLQPVQRGRNVAYLPMAHIAERQIGYYSALSAGMTITTLIDARKLQAALLEVRPTWFFGVPRTYEKIEVAMLEQVRDAETQRALDAAVQRVRDGDPWVDDPLLKPIREASGLEHAGWAGISGAPCSREMAERFHAVGIPLSEAWGMSETVIGTGAAPGRIRIGSAGWPYDGTDIKLGDDGEILLKSPSVTPGYLKDPERTLEAFTEDGYIRTGDLARFDEDGYMWVVGRKKDIIINSAGKNMSPVNIEQAIRGTDAVIAQVVCFGDGRPYNVGLIVLDPLQAAALAGENLSPEELAEHPTVVAHVARVVEEGNARLSRVEQLKRYVIHDSAWAPGSDELTLTGKLKRADVNAKYAELVDDLYLTPAA